MLNSGKSIFWGYKVKNTKIKEGENLEEKECTGTGKIARKRICMNWEDWGMEKW